MKELSAEIIKVIKDIVIEFFKALYKKRVL